MKKKPRIAIIGLGPLFERSWVETGILEKLREQLDLQVFLSYPNKTMSQSIDIQKYFGSREKKIVSILRNVAWITYRKKSPSFQFWIKRYYFSDYNWRQKEFSFYLQVKFFVNQLIRLLKIVISNKVSIWFLLPFKKIGFKVLVRLIVQNNKIIELFSDFDLVIIHSASNEVYAPLITHSLNKAGVKSLMTIENWDNLTSKQILFEKPEFVTVMGPADVKNARIIHGFDDSQIFPIGLPKFDFLRDYKRKPEALNTELVLLYIGFHLPHDEITFLNQLYDLLCTQEIQFTIHYRPHPNARKRIAGSNLNKNITIVDSLEIDVDSGLPTLNASYLQDILKADLVIGPPTTLIIECMILNVPCILDVTIDSRHRTTSGKSVENYLHLQDFLSEFQYLAFHNVWDCIRMIKEFNFKRTRFRIYPGLDKFVSQGDVDFSTKLLDAINKITKAY